MLVLLRSVKVKVSVPEAEIGGITASTPSTINVEAAHSTVSGGRIEKGVQADALTHTYDVRINVQAAENYCRAWLPALSSLPKVRRALLVSHTGQ